MSAADLAEVRRSFALLSTDGLRSAYADALERCKLDKRGRPPRADQIQVLVQAWRVLRKETQAATASLGSPSAPASCGSRREARRDIQISF
jgi:hypothetical protein